jgi:hypothetical protein
MSQRILTVGFFAGQIKKSSLVPRGSTTAKESSLASPTSPCAVLRHSLLSTVLELGDELLSQSPHSQPFCQTH